MIKLLVLLPLLAVLLAFTPAPAPTPEKSGPEIPADIQALLDRHGCAACHNMARKLVGPKWTDIAAKKYSAKRIIALIKKPEPANWPGYVPMLAQPTVPKADLTKISNWLAGLQ